MIKYLISLIFLSLCVSLHAYTIETCDVRVSTPHLPDKTEPNWNKFEFGTSKIKWHNIDMFGEKRLFQELNILSKTNGTQNDSVNIVNYTAQSKLGKFKISKRTYRQNSSGFRTVIAVDWTTASNREMPKQFFSTETAKGNKIETTLFKYEQDSENSDFVPMHNTIIFDAANSKFYIINDDGNQTVFNIIGTPIESSKDGVSISVFSGKVGDLNAKLVNMIPEDTTQPTMICLVHMLGDIEAMKSWYSTEGLTDTD